MIFEPPKIPHKVRAFFQKTIRIHFRLKKTKIKSSKEPFTYSYQLKPDKPNQPKSQKQAYYYTLKVNS
jgi:hypothetical protein